ncbi:MAG: hypothetical protein K6B13_01385 [Prevotella sp.]|nr:hypothetical protein [Prevotella sp.]
MKRLLLSLVSVFAMSIAALALNNSAVLLLHNGNMTTYEAEQINDAMETAADDDLILLSEGTYPAFDITKKITVRGTGEMTVINGDVNIVIPNEPTLTKNLMEFLKITGSLNVKSPIKRMSIKQCNINHNNGGYVRIQAKVSDSYFDRCRIGHLDITGTYEEKITVNGVTSTFITPFAKGLTVTNSVVKEAWGVDSAPSSAYDGKINTGSTFLNCYIGRAEHSLGKVVNSIIRYTQWPLECTDFINTYFGRDTRRNENTCTFTNCYYRPVELPTDFNYEDLTDEGYLGNDGTIIGPLGGNTPYTLTPAVPKVTESSMKVDAEKKQLNVTLTVSPK